MNPNKHPLTIQDLVKPFMIVILVINPLDDCKSADEDSLLPGNDLEDEFDVKELQEEVDAENDIEKVCKKTNEYIIICPDRNAKVGIKPPFKNFSLTFLSK